MTNPFSRYQTDTLILLVGGNPLPNYVAAQLLAEQKTHLLLVYSQGTSEQCTRLKKTLRARGYQTINEHQVEESDPANIGTKLGVALQKCTGSVGLNYTGGTKAMAVHAYRTLERASGLTRRIYSYLDARTLQMWFTDEENNSPSLPIGTRVPVSLAELLELHGLEKRKREMSEEVRWPATTEVLAALHADAERHKAWRAWCNTVLRDPEKEGDFRSTGSLKIQTTEGIPDDGVIQAIEADTGLTLPVSLGELWQLKKDVNKWLDGQWFEEYVFRHLKTLRQECDLNDLKMTINPAIGSSDFEFDVGCMRGHQFFGLSCTTDDGERKGGEARLKSKLLEASVRAEQLGGSEACFALVCCADSDKVEKLKDQMIGLPGDSRMHVFGRGDLLNLQAHMREWIRRASNAA